jgi:hypothetical protein
VESGDSLSHPRANVVKERMIEFGKFTQNNALCEGFCTPRFEKCTVCCTLTLPVERSIADHEAQGAHHGATETQRESIWSGILRAFVRGERDKLKCDPNSAGILLCSW